MGYVVQNFLRNKIFPVKENVLQNFYPSWMAALPIV